MLLSYTSCKVCASPSLVCQTILLTRGWVGTRREVGWVQDYYVFECGADNSTLELTFWCSSSPKRYHFNYLDEKYNTVFLTNVLKDVCTMSYIVQELWGYLCCHWSINIPRENCIAANSIPIASQRRFYHQRITKELKNKCS